MRHEVHGPVADAAGLRHARARPRSSGARVASSQRANFRQCSFSPRCQPWSPQKTMIVLSLVGALVEGVEQPADHGVAVGDGREVALHRLLPPARLRASARGRPAAWPSARRPAGRRPGRPRSVGGSLIESSGKHVVILPRHVPGHVRLVQAARRGRTACRASCRAARCRTRRSSTSRQVFVLAVERGELDPADAVVLPVGCGVACPAAREVVVPLAAARRYASW